MFKVWRHVKTLESTEYVVLFYRKFEVEEMQMTVNNKMVFNNPTDVFYAEVRKFRTNRYGREVADVESESFTGPIIDKNTANMLYFTIKASFITFNQLRDCFREWDKWEKRLI